MRIKPEILVKYTEGLKAGEAGILYLTYANRES